MTLRPLITAAEAFPALERMAFAAEQELLLSFRILDPRTALRAEELRAEGFETWGDLIAALSARGVRVRMLLADFDPLMAQALHRLAWLSASGFADRVQGDAQILCAPHGQMAGSVWRWAMRKPLAEAMETLRRAEPGSLTPVQRETLKHGPCPRPATLHQKFAIADGSACVIGGLDINERRFDGPDHALPAEQTWHDVSVLVEDADFIGALTAHFADCWNASLGQAASLAAPAQPMAADTRRQARPDLRLLRTLSRPAPGAWRLGPEPVVTDHEAAYLQLIEQAQQAIYIETQFLRHAPIAEALTKAAQRTPGLQLILVLPLAPERVLFEGADGWDARHAHGLQTVALTKLQKAFGTRLALVTPAAPRAADGEVQVDGAPPIYLHSKVMMVDGLVTVVGSANLNGRSLRWDSEASVMVRNADATQELMTRLAGIWLPDSAGDPWAAATWRNAAEAAAKAAPAARKAMVLPYPMDRAEAFSRRLFGLPDELF